MAQQYLLRCSNCKWLRKYFTEDEIEDIYEVKSCPTCSKKYRCPKCGYQITRVKVRS